MKLLKIIPLTFVLLLGACSTNDTGSSSQPVNPSTPSETSELDLEGFDLKKTLAFTTNGTYNLADQITLHTGVSLGDLTFMGPIGDDPVASVNTSGVITKIKYGSTQISIYKTSLGIFFAKTFTIHFFPTENAQIGTFSAVMDDVKDHETEKSTVTLVTKADNTFTINYTAGWIRTGADKEDPTGTYHITEPIQAEGTYVLDSMFRFTITTEAFPFQKTFGGRMVFDGNNPIIDSRVPVDSSNTSNRTNFNKVVA